jgi:hypothetical protein
VTIAIAPLEPEPKEFVHERTLDGRQVPDLDVLQPGGSSRVNERTTGGYARVSTEQQDLTSQHNGLHTLGVGDDRIYVDHGLTGTNRDRPGLRLALAGW